MHEITVKNKEANTHASDVAEKRRSNKAREKIDVGQFEDKKFIEIMKTIFGKQGVLGAAGNALKSFNDFLWYSKVPQLIDAVAKFPSYTPSDTFFYECVAAARDPQGTVSQSRQFIVVPSLMAIRYVPTIGAYSGAYSSAASNAARRLYNIIRQANSAASAYDPGELMKIIIAVGSVYGELINMKRALQALNKDDDYSRAFSRLVVTACGFNYDDMSKDREGWRSYYNTMVHLMTSFKIPSKLTIFMRWAWMNSLIIKDADNNDNCQRYLFRPALHYVYDDGTGTLKAVANDTIHTLNSFRTMLDTAYYGIFNSSAAITIFRDIQKAIDNGKIEANDMVYLTDISEEIYNEPFAEVYNPEVVNQIHNATLCGNISNVRDFDITTGSDGTMVMSNPVPDFRCLVKVSDGASKTASILTNYRGENHVISLLDNDTSIQRITVATRLKVRGELSKDEDNYFEFTADKFATEICTTAEIYTYDRGGTSQDFDPSNNVVTYYLAMNTYVDLNQEPIVRIYAQFDGAPKATFFAESGGTSHTFDAWRMHKVIFVVDPTIEGRLHDACVLSELSYL